MESFIEQTRVLHSDESKGLFRQNLLEEARKTNTMLYYTDLEGRWVEEWPATGELYEVQYDPKADKIIRLQTLHQLEPVIL